MPDPQRLTVPRDQLRNAGLQMAMNELRAGRPPLPLPRGQATRQALRLRERGLSYGDIAAVMALYHDQDAPEDSWRRRCRNAGAPPKPYGRPLCGPVEKPTEKREAA